ncbi:NADH-quinone oxidoreductase subunit J [Priestia abyssalis]|uniref:NADH-quinone oxidoreductase subunit J n=1 Tax=Priestia abyssalis TaxID=1221450 RepID=UPI000994F993|nr:NADH-quinone oxidoreductase subunit J [Priestia abyssalis]
MMWSGEFFAFISLALVAIIGAMLMIQLTKVVHMVVALVFTFVSIAGLFVLLSAEFVAAVQVLIYSGAITIIMLFGIMLTRHDDEEADQVSWRRKAFILVGLFSFGLVMFLGIQDLSFGEQATALHEENTKQIGVELYSKYIIPFELTSVVLLVALIGAIILAKKEEKEGEER